MAGTTREIQERILAECDRHYRDVRFTHEFGKWISQGINAARIAISSIPTDIEPLDFLQRALSLMDSVRRAVDNPNDEDGWTLGGVSTISRAILDERRKIEREQASTREGIMAAVRDAFDATMPDRRAVLWDQAWMLLLDPPPEIDEIAAARERCSFCREYSAFVQLRIGRTLCRVCFVAMSTNLKLAESGKPIPEPGMLIADLARALRAIEEPAADKIVREFERRATARRSRQPRGFLPACQGCGLNFERCRWTASLPGVDICDDCIRTATTRD